MRRGVSPVISETPNTYENAIWLEDSRKKRRCGRCTSDKRCNLCIKSIESEVSLIKFESESEIKKFLNKSKLIPISSFNDALFLSNIKYTEFEVLTPKRIQRLQKKVQGFKFFILKKNKRNFSIFKTL